jgi:hypothetical protein
MQPNISIVWGVRHPNKMTHTVLLFWLIFVVSLMQTRRRTIEAVHSEKQVLEIDQVA